MGETATTIRPSAASPIKGRVTLLVVNETVTGPEPCPASTSDTCRDPRSQRNVTMGAEGSIPNRATEAEPKVLISTLQRHSPDVIGASRQSLSRFDTGVITGLLGNTTGGGGNGAGRSTGGAQDANSTNATPPISDCARILPELARFAFIRILWNEGRR